MQKQALDVARKYEQEAKERLRRMSIMAAGLETPPFRKSTGGDEWYGEPRNAGQTFADVA